MLLSSARSPHPAQNADDILQLTADHGGSAVADLAFVDSRLRGNEETI